MPTEGVILSGVLKKTGLYLDGSLENPDFGCRRCKQMGNICESLRQKDSEVLKQQEKSCICAVETQVALTGRTFRSMGYPMDFFSIHETAAVFSVS